MILLLKFLHVSNRGFSIVLVTCHMVKVQRVLDAQHGMCEGNPALAKELKRPLPGMGTITRRGLFITLPLDRLTSLKGLLNGINPGS